MSTVGGALLLGKDAISAAMRSGNVNIASNVQVEVMELSEESKEAQLKHAESLKRFEQQQRARSIVVPTAIEDVKSKLRELGHPITLFGEGHADRRERLREVIAKIELKGEELDKLQILMNQSTKVVSQETESGTSATKEAQQKEAFYSIASETLIAARRQISEWSIRRAHERILSTKRIRSSELLQGEEDRNVLKLYEHNKHLNLTASEFGDSRALTCISYSSSGQQLASGSLACTVKIWDSKISRCEQELNGHLERITNVCWMPSGSNGSLLASSSADATCILWDSVKGMETARDSDAMDVIGRRPVNPILQKFNGHVGVVSDCDFHPMGRHLGTAGHDFTWRMWDIETGSELLLQDGHIKECSAITFQCDGSLVLTADWAGVALLWDIRSGQCIHVFQGHVQKIVNASFSPNGFQVATGSIDHMVRVWDLRKRKCWYTLPAHSNVISDLRYSSSGELLVTSSFDGTAKLWNTRDFELIRSLPGHSGKVMSCDISPDEKEIVTAGFDRTIKVWKTK